MKRPRRWSTPPDLFSIYAAMLGMALAIFIASVYTTFLLDSISKRVSAIENRLAAPSEAEESPEPSYTSEEVPSPPPSAPAPRVLRYSPRYSRSKKKSSAATYNSLKAMQEVQKVWDQLPIGKLAFDPHSEMQVGEIDTVEVRIAGNPAIGLELIQGLKGSGKPELTNIKISSSMKARLYALNKEDFEIVAMTSEEQSVGSESFTDWMWAVKPLRSGSRQLHLTVTATINLAGIPPKDVFVAEKTIAVKVNALYSVISFTEKIGSGWQAP